MPQGDYVIIDKEISDQNGWAKTVTTTTYVGTTIASEAKLYLTEAAAQSDITNKIVPQGYSAARFGVGRKP